MKRINFALLFVTTLPLLAGCVSGPYANQGAAVGALVGAPVGALVGSSNGEAGAGALIGGTIGALAGSNIGAGVDAERQALRASQANGPRRLSIPEVVSMSQSGLGEDVIITQIQSQGLVQRPTTQDLIALKNSGLSDRVIQAMQTSPVTNASFQTVAPVSRPVVIEEHYWGPGFYPPPRYYGRHPRHYRPCPPRRGSSFSFSHRF